MSGAIWEFCVAWGFSTRLLLLWVVRAGSWLNHAEETLCVVRQIDRRQVRRPTGAVVTSDGRPPGCGLVWSPPPPAAPATARQPPLLRGRQGLQPRLVTRPLVLHGLNMSGRPHRSFSFSCPALSCPSAHDN
jgi:hypothetical protein